MGLSAEATERKVVTVVFADLAGSTELAGSMDPERFRELQAAFFAEASEVLESLRGRVEKFIGDAVMAVFGLPLAHEDDAIRGIRAAFAIRDRTARLAEQMGLASPLEVRVGVASGPVAASAASVGDQFLVSGPTVNLAARLQQAAAPGEVLASETTRVLTLETVEYGERRTVEARGFEGAVAAWPALRVSARSSRRTIPLVGRRRELSLLRDTFERARELSRAHMVTVVGEAGIGKTRLADELLSGLEEEVRVLSGRASDFDEDPTFAPLGDIVRRVLDVEREAPRQVLRERLHEVVEGCCDVSETEQVVARLGIALGLDGDREDRTSEATDGEGRRYRLAEVRAGFLTFLDGLSRTAPVVLVLDDLHLARPPLLDLVEEVVKRIRRSPILVLALARERLLEDRPGWGGGIPDAMTIRLEPLPQAEAADLAMAAGGEVRADTAEKIAQHSGGNPFFIVETTGMLLMGDHTDDVVGGLHSHLIPPTVQAVIASRIDHLTAPARELVRRASVLPGARVERWELKLVADPTDQLIDALEAAELLVRDEGTEEAWRFRHDLLRDVAYESLSKRDRLRLHLQAADGLSEADGDRHTRGIAFHLEQAARASLDLDPADRTLPDRAIPALHRAGNLARWRMESRSAIDLYNRALALAGPEEEWGPREGRILAGIGESRYWLGEYDDGQRILERALAVSGPDPWTRTHALRFLADITLNVRGDPDRADDLFDQALAAAREHGDQWAMARTLLMAGWAPYWKHDLASARDRFEEALRLARSGPRHDMLSESRALVSLISVTSPVGTEDECLTLGQQAMDVAMEAGDPFSVAVAQGYLANSLRRMLELDRAATYVGAAVRIFADLDARWEHASTLGDRATIRRLQGRFEDAEEDLGEALSIARSMAEPNLIASAAGSLVFAIAASGDRERAMSTFRDLRVELAAEPGFPSSLYSTESTIALLEGDRDRALGRALLLLEKQRQVGWANHLAGEVWWVGRIFGPDAAGGQGELDRAGEQLKRAGWLHQLSDPDRFLEVYPDLAPAPAASPAPAAEAR